jgi:hypothetical protein
MNPRKAKNLLVGELQRLNIPYIRLTARTISFMDLLRKSDVFVKIHGWRPNPIMKELKVFSHENGFCIETDWMFS